MTEIGNRDRQEGRWLNNRVENSYLPFRRRERAMLRCRRMKSLQKFAAVHANIHHHFDSERHVLIITLPTSRRRCFMDGDRLRAVSSKWRSRLPSK